MVRTTVHVTATLLCVLGSVYLSWLGIDWHDQYAAASAAAMRGEASAGGGANPERFFQNAQLALMAITAIAVTALALGICFRRLEWFVAFVLCAVIAIITFINVGVRY